MSTVIGFKVVESGIRWVAVSGTRSNPVYVDHDRVVVPKGMRPDEVVNWAETEFGNVIDRLKPDALVYRMTNAPRTAFDRVFHVYYPLAVINLVAYKRSLPISHVSSLQPKAFGLPQSSDPKAHIACLLGDHSPHWDKDALEAAAVAAARLPQ